MSTVYFTYYIYHPETNSHYYGARWKDRCHPNDLWTLYFTSSKKVHSLIEQFGVDSFVAEIRKTFNTKSECISWEQKVLKRLKVKKNDKWLNIAIGKPTMLGKHHSEKTKQKMRKPKGPWSEERKKAKSEQMKKNIQAGTQRVPSTKGTTWSPQMRENMKKRIPWNKGLKLK
jgi:hypothetical protein